MFWGCIAEPGRAVKPETPPPTVEWRPPVFHSERVSKTPKPAPKGRIVALTRTRAQLDRFRRSRRADALFAATDPASAIRSLPADEFFYVVHELGFPDALDIMSHGTAEQVQGALDLAIWDRDRISAGRADEWLEAIAEAPYETAAAWARGLDVELLALLIRQRARIYDLSLEEPPDEPEGSLFDTPDRLFTLELLGDEQTQRTTRHLIENLYRADQTMMRRFLVGMRSEIDVELEETAFRWRSGRMADLGFVDFYEALEVYRELNPASVQPETGPVGSGRPRDEPAADSHLLRLPLVMADRLADTTPFARAVAGLTSAAEAADLHANLVALCNRVLSADRVSPGDDPEVARVLARVAATLDLAVEFLSRGDDAAGVVAVRRVPLTKLFRLGVSLVGKLQKLARSLVRNSPFAALRPAVDLWEPEDAEVIGALTRLRPLFPRLLDQPPSAGERPFGSLHDLATATTAMERAGAALALVVGLGVRPEHISPARLGVMGIADPAILDTGLLARTVLVRLLLGQAPGPVEPLPDEAISSFKEKFSNSTQHVETMAQSAATILQSAAPGARFTPATEAVATRWLHSLAPLGPVLIADRSNRSPR
jgi:hypothetical protein